MDPSESLPGTQELAVEPSQPPSVVQALQELLGEPGPPVDPWWRAGNDDALGA